MPEMTIETEYAGKGTRCEGWRRKGGFMSLGNPEWRQCQNQAVVVVKFTQANSGVKKGKLPACITCWEEAMTNTDISVKSVTPLPKEANHDS